MAVVKATQRLELFIAEQRHALSEIQKEINTANNAILAQPQNIDKAKKFVEDNENNIPLSMVVMPPYIDGPCQF